MAMLKVISLTQMAALKAHLADSDGDTKGSPDFDDTKDGLSSWINPALAEPMTDGWLAGSGVTCCWLL
jgi:hypothetical protein